MGNMTVSLNEIIIFNVPAFYSEIQEKNKILQVGDFMILHLLGQNLNLVMFNELLEEICRRIQFGSSSDASPTSVPSAPSTLEMAPIYPEIEKCYAKDTEI